jgi:hypothetical protein
MSVRSFTAIIEDHAKRVRDLEEQDDALLLKLGVSLRTTPPRMVAEPKYPPVSDSEWNHLTGR